MSKRKKPNPSERLKASLALTKLVRRRRKVDDDYFERTMTRDKLVAYMRSFLHDLERDIAAEAAGELSVDGYRALFRADGTFFGIGRNV